MKFTEVLSYHRCNLMLFKITFKGQYQPFVGVKIVLGFVISLEFFFRRTISLLLRKVFKFQTSESWRFPRLGIKEIYYTGIPTDRKEIGDCCFEKLPSKSFNISIPSFTEQKCADKLRHFGLDSGQKYVCLHVRESGYRSDKGRREYRNAEIKNYVDGVSKLINDGYLIFRLGDDSMTPFPVKIKGLIDYPFMALKSDEMDLYLLKNCDFFIGMQSGLLDTAWLFQKPVLITNMYNAFTTFPRNIEDRGIFKHVKLKGTNNFFSLREWFQQSWSAHSYSREISEYEFIENSTEEIYDAINEFILIQTKRLDSSPNELQKKFNHLLKETLRNHILKKKTSAIDTFSNLPNLQKVRMGRMIMSSQGAISASFLGENF